jgi:hypothetical protein
MRKRTILTTMAMLALVAAGTAIAARQSTATHRKTARSSYSFVVPARVQRSIAHHYRQLDYLPTRLPRGLHYTSYSGVRGFQFTIWFSGLRAPSLQYGVTVADCGAQGSPMHTFTVNGLQISWSGSYTEQQAWRCVTRGQTTLTVSAGRSVEGDANPLAGNKLTRKQRKDALQLAMVVAYAKPIR